MAKNSISEYNINETLKDKEGGDCGDINQNFLNQRNGGLTLNPKQHIQQLRGINSMKASPDSGWTFPNIINSQILQQNYSQQQANSLNESSKNRSRDLHLPLINHHENSYHPGIFQDVYQPKMVSPLVDMSPQRRQQLHQQQIQQIQKQRSQNFGNALTPNSSLYYPGLLQYDRFVKTPVSNPNKQLNQHLKTYNGVRFSNTDLDKSEDTMGSSKTPKNNPQLELGVHEQTLPPFVNFSSSIPIVGSPQFQVAIAAAQMKTYYSFLKQSNSNYSSNINQSPNNEFVSNGTQKSQHYNNLTPVNKTPSSMSLNDSKMETVTTKPSRPTLLGKKVLFQWESCFNL